MYSSMTKILQTYSAIGLMSGTSLDGLDVAYCEFSVDDEHHWKFSIPFAETYDYPIYISTGLRDAPVQNGEKLHALSVAFGQHSAERVNQFIKDHPCNPQLIASHGHTVFHRPELGHTLQIGSGAEIAAKTGILTVCDFRSADVALGGQGAPLVPVGDRLLFGHYDYCLNIGGFANISYEHAGQRIAYDIAPANIVLNVLALLTGKPFDENGAMAAEGSVIGAMLEQLEQLAYYHQPPPKSLGREWLEQSFLPLVQQFSGQGITNQLRTLTEHIAMQIARSAASAKPGSKMLITGGGALNTFLVDRIRAHTNLVIELPPIQQIQYKEALIFALLGVLRLRGEHNCLSSVTGALRDHCSGCIYPGKAQTQTLEH